MFLVTDQLSDACGLSIAKWFCVRVWAGLIHPPSARGGPAPVPVPLASGCRVRPLLRCSASLFPAVRVAALGVSRLRVGLQSGVCAAASWGWRRLVTWWGALSWLGFCLPVRGLSDRMRYATVQGSLSGVGLHDPGFTLLVLLAVASLRYAAICGQSKFSRSKLCFAFDRTGFMPGLDGFCQN